jgi:hypothetical protein
MIAIWFLRSPICDGKSSTSGVVWVGVEGWMDMPQICWKNAAAAMKPAGIGWLVDGKPAVAKAAAFNREESKSTP